MEEVILGMVKDDRKRGLELKEVALRFMNDQISWTPSSITYTIRYDDVSGGIDKGPCILDGLTDAAKDSLVDMLTLAERTDGYFTRMDSNIRDQLTSIDILKTLDASLGQELDPVAIALNKIQETAEAQCRVKIARCIWKRVRDVVDNFDVTLAEKRARKRQKNIKDSLQKEIRIHKNNIQQAEKDNAKRTREIKRLEKLLKQIEGGENDKTN